MPLVKATLKSSILATLNSLKTEEDQTAAIDKLADDLANHIDTYIKTATITVSAGIPVATAGSPSAQTGATTAPSIASIS